MTPEEEFEDLLKNHDWYYYMSDDNRVYRNGHAASKRLSVLAEQLGRMNELEEERNKYPPPCLQ